MPETPERPYFIDGLRPQRKDLSDEALRARLQDLQSTHPNAAQAVERELQHRERWATNAKS